jgi:hypothetical protein
LVAIYFSFWLANGVILSQLSLECALGRSIFIVVVIDCCEGYFDLERVYLPFYLSSAAVIPGSSLPSRYSSDAPPPVEI